MTRNDPHRSPRADPPVRGQRPDGARTDPGPGDRVGEFVLERVLGSGSFGVVWKARHAVFPDRIVALKVARDPRLVELLVQPPASGKSVVRGKPAPSRGVRRSLQHPGVVQLLGADLDAPTPYVVQEYVAGGDLGRLLRSSQRLRPERALTLFHELVEILAHAHRAGVVHGDLKPGNLLLDGEGHLRVTDFGLASGLRALVAIDPDAARGSQRLALASCAVGGTWEYAAPEVRQAALNPAGSARIDARADVWSLGILLYELLEGRRPAGRVGLAHISPEIDAIFARCWTSWDMRYRDAIDLLADLERVRGGHYDVRRRPKRRRRSDETKEEAPTRPARRRGRKSKPAYPGGKALFHRMAILLGILGALALGLWWWMGW